MARCQSCFDTAKKYFELPESEQARIDKEVKLSLDFESLLESTINCCKNTKEIKAYYAVQGHSDNIWIKAPNNLTGKSSAIS
jgi:hypothetical protein